MRQIISELEKVRQRSRAMLLTQRLAILVAWIAGIVLGLVMAMPKMKHLRELHYRPTLPGSRV